MTLVILALDALDAGLVERFGAADFELESTTEIETFAHARDVPYTMEIWPSVATGVPPDVHGVTGAGTSEWKNPLLELGSLISSRFPEGTRGRWGRLVREKTGQRETLGRTSEPTFFDMEGAVVRNWPGVTDGSDLQYAWDLMHAVTQGMPRAEFERKLLGRGAEQFGWAREMLHHDVRVAGVHIHTLDAAGHAYSDDESALSAIYERVGEYVTEIRHALSDDDDLLLVSDHGIATTFLDGDDSAGHSWRAYASATTDDVPESVYDVKAWVERHAPDASSGEEEAIDLPAERLRDLGYI